MEDHLLSDIVFFSHHVTGKRAQRKNNVRGVFRYQTYSNTYRTDARSPPATQKAAEANGSRCGTRC